MDIITFISHFPLEIISFLIKLWIFFLIKTVYSLIDFDMIFPIQPSEFMWSLNFRSNLKKTEKET